MRKTVEVPRLSVYSTGLVTVALQSALVQNMGKIKGVFGHKTRRQAKRIYYYYFFGKSSLEKNTNSTEYYCFTWKKPDPLQRFVVTSHKSPGKEWCHCCGRSLCPSLLSIPPPPPPPPPPPICTSKPVHSISHVFVGADFNIPP